TIDLTDIHFSNIISLLWGAYELQLNKLCNYIETLIVEEKDLVWKYISLINRKGLSNFTKLSELWRKIIVENVNIFKSDNFITLQKEEFHYFYINRLNNITKIRLWEKLLKWSTYSKPPISTSDDKLPIFVEINLESTKVKSTADILSKSTTTMEFIPTINTSISNTIISTRPLTIQSNIIGQQHIKLIKLLKIFIIHLQQVLYFH
ncbi:22511_t:CDS:2, partial [Dentiscutata erythropus]